MNKIIKCERCDQEVQIKAHTAFQRGVHYIGKAADIERAAIIDLIEKLCAEEKTSCFGPIEILSQAITLIRKRGM